jgi:hypothetical protein
VSRITIAPIVEGHGENGAIRNLLWRTWTEIVGGEHAEILHPIRRSRGRFLKIEEGDVEKAVGLAALKLKDVGGGLILILVDAEDDCAKLGSLGPILLQRARQAHADMDIACVIANVMYETWFVAAAESLGDYLDAPKDDIPEDPEAARAGKGWIKLHMRSGHYSETADQPSLSTMMDLKLCRSRSRSFDKLCRELELRHQKMLAANAI